MIKINALNEESQEDSDSEEDVTREALEQIALQQYAKALDIQRKGNIRDASLLLKDLLNTEVLYDVKKPAPGEKVTSPLFNLKYLCYKNLAALLSSLGEIEAAIDASCSAAELDDTDLTLWYRLGQLCMQAKNYEMALQSFQRGTECNPRHWPCIDKIVTLLLGLNHKEECIYVIYEAFKLDPDYLRGLVYRRHIYTVFRHVREFLEYLNPIYKWNESDELLIDEHKAATLLKEAEVIQETFIDQQNANKFKHILPDLKLKKPISNLTWHSVGDSLIHMHEYMTENCFSHACKIELVFEKENIIEPMDVCEEPKKTEALDNKIEENDSDKNIENASESENNDMSDKDKVATDSEKVESDIELILVEPITEATDVQKVQKKVPVRRRGSALSALQQWNWCKTRPVRKKPVNRQEDDNIYNMVWRLVPIGLIKKKEGLTEASSLDVKGLDNFFEEKIQDNEEYFGSQYEQTEVQQFINKYKEMNSDIIDILKDYLGILSKKWKVMWPETLSKIFIKANKCYNNHIDVPSPTDDKNEQLLHYIPVNLLVEEFCVNNKFNIISNTADFQRYDLSVLDTVSLALTFQPNIVDSIDCLEFTLRCLWVKLHVHILNKCDEFAIDTLYQLLYQFESMGEHCNTYSLIIINFTFKPIINDREISAYIKFLERNKKLSTVMELFNTGNYEEVLSIVIDSFEHCKDMARKQEEEMSLDFAVQLCLILDTFWALEKVNECFKWSFICLHESLKHYFRYSPDSPDNKKWTRCVVKILCCMEHILKTEGLSCLDTILQEDLSQGLEDIIRIIVHQVEKNSTDMPFDTVIPWIIMYYILQREDDHGRGRTIDDKDKTSCDDVPNPLMVLFIGHEQLGNRGWCCKNDGKLLYFTLDTVCPRLRSPLLLKCLEQLCQYMEQCVCCLFGYPGRKSKLKYLADHNVTPYSLNWDRALQVYEIFRPPSLPALEGKLSGLTVDTENLFLQILNLLPSEYDPTKYVTEIEKYIKGIEQKIPTFPSLLPYKMRDIYFLLGDYYFKKEEGKLAVKYNMIDLVINSCRFESWAEISLAKAVNLERILNSCKNLNNEREFLNPAKSIIRCFKRALALDPSQCNMWIEYGMFVYSVHSFCSRVLKQASESLSMEDFESLEKQKEDMLDTTQKCFSIVMDDLNSKSDADREKEEDSWLHYYMLGKVAEKRNKSPSVYLDFYIKGVKSLEETSATYPLKINYNSPTHLCIEVLELHYRIHASILKYIEQHENKPIPASIGKIFLTCIEDWKKIPFVKKSKKDGVTEMESEVKVDEPVQAANILKRSISDAGEEDTVEAKRLKLEAAAAKVRRSASYDTEMIVPKESTSTVPAETSVEKGTIVEEKKPDDTTIEDKNELPKSLISEVNKEFSEKSQEKETESKESSSSNSSSSSDSGSSNSTSDSSSTSTRDSDASKSSSKSENTKPISDEELMNIISACLDALEDCASRFPPHYKAIYRLAHYHFYYKKGKDIERCRDLMLSTFTSRAGQKLGGLFSERNKSNFFNNIWKIPITEVDRSGGFAFHMNRSVLLTMEILKEIDDHKTLLDLSLHLQRIPEPDKTYLRDSDREDLAQQAYSLCVQSLKGQLLKFSQQADLKSNDVEQQAFKSLMLDIFRAHNRAQKQMNCKQLTNLLVDGYKLVTDVGESTNLIELSIKYCQSLIQTLRQQATIASMDKNQNMQKKQTAKATVESTKSTSTASQSKSDSKVPSYSAALSNLSKMTPQEMVAAAYLSMMSDPMQQTAAALSYMSGIPGYPYIQNTMQTSLKNTNSFQAEFYRQYLGQSYSSYLQPPKKQQKRGPKPTYRPTPVSIAAAKPIKSLTNAISSSSTPKVNTASVITTMHKSASAPSMGSVLQTLPASMAGLSSYTHSTPSTPSLPAQAHVSTASTLNAAIHTKPPLPHQQLSQGKTLQEKLAERQKILPKGASQEMTASICKLPSSLTITKSSVPKSSASKAKKPEVKKSLPFNDGDVIVLDDD